MGIKRSGDLEQGPPARQMLERHFWRTANQLDEIGKAMGRSTSESEDEPGKLIEEGDRLLVRLRRIIKYLGIQWKLPAPDESGVAELIRKGVERGESFEAINRTVEFYLRGFGVQKLGRPIASGESDGIALRALGRIDIYTLQRASWLLKWRYGESV